MRNTLKHLKWAALTGFLITLPFIAMEWVNRRTFRESFGEDFAFSVFGILWLLSTTFTVLWMPVVHNIRTGNSIAANPAVLLIRAVFLTAAVWLWAFIVADQMPCFLGYANCD